MTPRTVIRCSSCREEKPADLYYPSRQARGSGECPDCARARTAERKKGKACARCHRLRPLRHFYLRPKGTPHSWCKDCELDYAKGYRRLHPRTAEQRRREAERERARKATQGDRFPTAPLRDAITAFALRQYGPGQEGGIPLICFEDFAKRFDHDATRMRNRVMNWGKTSSTTDAFLADEWAAFIGSHMSIIYGAKWVAA